MQASPSRPLIDVDELAGLLPLGTCTVLDVRYQMGGPSGLEEYAAGHVPGAAYVDLDTALAGTPGPRGRHPLPEVAVFEEAMRVAGVSDDRPVVVYDDWAGRAAARCWWLLRWAGHRDVRVLDGGWSAWRASGRGTADGAAGPAARRLHAPGRVSSRSSRPTTCSRSQTTHVLVDARTPERFRGDVEPVDPVAGHIPGAVNVPTGREPRRRRTVPLCRRAGRGLRGCRRSGGRGVLRLGGHRRPTTSSRWPWPGSTPRCTPARGASGWPIPTRGHGRYGLGLAERPGRPRTHRVLQG